MSKFFSVKDASGQQIICAKNDSGHTFLVETDRVIAYLNVGFRESCELRLLRIQHAVALAKIEELSAEVACG